MGGSVRISKIKIENFANFSEFEIETGYHEFVRARSSVPFVADDIMETFDDFRAEEAFRLFAEMAQVGQVIYLTHHQHLCEIVQRVCPAARVHRLEEAASKRKVA
jgi:uncharacterized protein YhaN